MKWRPGGLDKEGLVPSQVQGEAQAQGCHQICQEPKPGDLVKAVGQHLPSTPLLSQATIFSSDGAWSGQGLSFHLALRTYCYHCTYTQPCN